jgi:hypothetical protein
LSRTFAAALLVSLGLVLPAVSRAQDAPPMFSHAVFVATGGVLIPAGEEGEELDFGPHAGLCLLYEASNGLVTGLEGTYSRSNDAFRTSITSLGFNARLSPAPEYHTAFLQLGVGAYRVSYDPSDPNLVAPESKFHPGGSFGFGFEFFRWGKFALGANGTYHGIVISRSDALAFIAAGATLTWRPGEL